MIFNNRKSPTIRMTELTRDQLRECVRWIYARVMPDWSTPTKKLIQAGSTLNKNFLTLTLSGFQILNDQAK